MYLGNAEWEQGHLDEEGSFVSLRLLLLLLKFPWLQITRIDSGKQAKKEFIGKIAGWLRERKGQTSRSLRE